MAKHGVAALHTEILKNLELVLMTSTQKIQNKTNGNTFRRYSCMPTSRLSLLMKFLVMAGTYQAEELSFTAKIKLLSRKKIKSVKAHNKRKLARHLKEHQGVEINPNSIFDIQIASSRVQTPTNERFVCDSQIP